MCVATAFLAELTERDTTDGWWLTGRFYGHIESDGRVVARFEDLDVDGALAWARERAEKVLIQFDSEYFSAGREHPPKAPRWPPEDLEALVRRRDPDDRWRDRTDAGPPIAWTIVVCLTPPGGSRDLDEDERQRDAWCDVAATVARDAGAQRWDSASFDWYLRDRLKARAEAAPGDGYFVYARAPAAFRLLLTADAATPEAATEQALSRCALPAGWTADGSALPTAHERGHRGPDGWPSGGRPG